jgi:hypothetical protein
LILQTTPALQIAVMLLLGGGLLYSQEPPAPPANPEKQLADKMAEAQKRLQKLTDTEYKLGEIQINAATRELRLPCVVLHQQIPIEYLLVHETGKDHETILTTAVTPLDLQVALLLANYTPGSTGLFAKLPKGEPLPFQEQAPKTPGAHRVKLTAEWEIDGKKHTSPLSQWIQNSDLRVPPPDLDAWIFNGSKIDNRGFVAESEGSLIAVYADANALFNSPAAGNHTDDIWISLPKNIPPEGTPITLIITPAP